MSRQTIDKLLDTLGKLPKNVATIVHDARTPAPHKSGHHNGVHATDQQLTEEEFSAYVFHLIAEHYQKRHPGTRLESAMLYAHKSFGDVVTQMYRGYAAGHHTLEMYADALRDTPHG